MKAWEKHLADLYLLATDILDNHYHQQDAYKGGFYYAFNPSLSYIQSNGSYAAQLKLLQQLADKGALSFEVKQPTKATTDKFISKGVATSPYKKLVRLHINPGRFNEVYEDFKPYKPPEAAYTDEDSVMVHLLVFEHCLWFKTSESTRKYKLAEFRVDGYPSSLFEYLVNTMANTRVTKSMLAKSLETNRSFNDIVSKALSPFARDKFVPMRTENTICVNTPVPLTRTEFQRLKNEAKG